jgi:DNA-binding NtrC family response regulator
MFGHEKGAFTGAIARRKGRFEAADGGTLFLDEVAEIPPATQVKLLRVLQEHTFERVGGNETIHADVRLVTATNVDVEQAVRAGKLREDLYYRLKVVTIRLPPLRDRRDDVPALARHFAAKFAAENGKPAPRIDPAAMASLAAYSWPGNVRELENVIENAVVMARGDVLTPDLVAMGGSPRPAPESEGVLRFLPGTPLAEVEKRMILDTLRAEGGNKSKAAERLGIGVRTLYRKIEEYGFKEFSREGRKETAPAGEGEPASEGESPGAPGEDGKK